MTNAQAYKRALKAVRSFMSVLDDGGSPIQQDMASGEVESALQEALAYEFKKGPKPYWMETPND